MKEINTFLKNKCAKFDRRLPEEPPVGSLMKNLILKIK